MVTTDGELYRRSSQYRLWSFTKQGLHDKMQEANRRVPPNEHTLSVEEEHQLVQYIAAVQIKSICDVFELPSQVRATAVSYFRKFYLQYSVMEYRPKLILSTCVFLAAKSENAYLPIQKFTESLKDIEPSQILDLEFQLFKTLDFTLQVHNALRPLHGFFLDMQAVLTSYTPQNLATFHDQAKAFILDGFVSDAIFLYTPTHIALAALMEANELATTEYMAYAMDGPNSSLQRLLSIVTECRAMLQVQLPPAETVKAYSKKLNQYHKMMDSEGPEKKRLRSE